MTPQNLASWNPSNPECLLLVVKELVQQYHQFQCSRLRESSRLMFEYQTLLEEPQYGENMEIYAGKKNNWVSAERGTLLCDGIRDKKNLRMSLSSEL